MSIRFHPEASESITFQKILQNLMTHVVAPSNKKSSHSIQFDVLKNWFLFFWFRDFLSFSSSCCCYLLLSLHFLRKEVFLFFFQTSWQVRGINASKMIGFVDFHSRTEIPMNKKRKGIARHQKPRILLGFTGFRFVLPSFT